MNRINAVRPPPHVRSAARPSVPAMATYGFVDGQDSRSQNFVRRAAYVFAALIFLRLVISDPLLNQYYPYSEEGGLLLIKIHPATYGLLILLGIMLLRGRFVLNRMEVRLSRGLFQLIGVLFLLLFYIMAMGRLVSVGALLETYVAACLIAFTMFLFPLDCRRMIGNTILVFLVVNSVIAIIEKALEVRFYPYPYVEETFRPTGMTSHPLVIGLLNAGGVVFVLATRWPGWIKIICLGLIVMGAFAAGARTGAIFASLACIAALVITPMPGRTAEMRMQMKVIVLSALVFIAPLLLLVADSAGFLERFTGGYIDKNAEARINVYRVFDWVSTQQILFGSDLIAIKKMVFDRLGILVESSIVNFVFMFGLFGAILFAVSLLYALLRLAAGSDRRAFIGLGAFIGVGMSNDAFSSKHCYVLFMMLLLIAYRRDIPDAFGRFHRISWDAPDPVSTRSYNG